MMNGFVNVAALNIIAKIIHTMSRPLATDTAPYFQKYIALAQGDSVAEIIANHSNNIINFYNNLPAEKADYAYAAGKWTLKDLLQHLMDAERVFVYRALRFARKDAQPLLGFEEDDYAANANAALRSFDSLKQEFAALRASTDMFLQSLTPEQLEQHGSASGNPLTVNAAGFIIYGHLLHHKNVIEEKYL